MAAPCTHVSKLGKLVCEFSSFTNEKSRHRKVVEEHYFNYAVSSNTLSCFDFLFHVSVFPFFGALCHSVDNNNTADKTLSMRVTVG